MTHSEGLACLAAVSCSSLRSWVCEEVSGHTLVLLVSRTHLYWVYEGDPVLARSATVDIVTSLMQPPGLTLHCIAMQHSYVVNVYRGKL